MSIEKQIKHIKSNVNHNQNNVKKQQVKPMGVKILKVLVPDNEETWCQPDASEVKTLTSLFYHQK